MYDRTSLVPRLGGAAIALVLAGVVPIPPSSAQDARASEATQQLPGDVVTEHALELPDRRLSFKATAGSIPITNAQGQTLAEMAYVAYALNGPPAAQRPVTFAMNGGPGSASAWLHIGAIGPWRLRMEEAAAAPSAPAPLLPNAETWLDFTDLVFIDPVGTGFSRITAAGKPDAEEKGRQHAREGSREEGGARYFWSVNGDVDSIADFIEKWLRKAGRLASPKLLVGESYGGFRGPRIAHVLQRRLGVALNGLVLVSPVLDFAGRRSGHPPIAFVALLPSLAAAELERRGQTVSREGLRSVEQYARDEYLRDLMRGPRDAEAVGRIVARVAEITGLPQETVRSHNGRIDAHAYDRAVNRPAGRLASMYDASFKGLDPNPASPGSRYADPFTTALNAPMTSAMLELYGVKLNYRTERPYVKMNGEANRSWIWGNSPTPPESVSALREVLALDPHLRVIVAHGYTDLVTPYFASQLILDQLPAIGDGQRVASTIYTGGHMFYSRDASRKAFREDALNLVERLIVEANAARPGAAATTE